MLSCVKASQSEGRRKLAVAVSGFTSFGTPYQGVSVSLPILGRFTSTKVAWAALGSSPDVHSITVEDSDRECARLEAWTL